MIKINPSHPTTLNRTPRVFSRLGLLTAVLCLYHQAIANPIAVELGAGSSFAVLGGSGITAVGAVNSSTINGDIGSHPTSTIVGLDNVILNGINHGADATTQTAKIDLVTAYLDAAGRASTTSYGAIFDLGGLTLTNGIYNGSSSFGLTGTLTLDGGGDANSVWIFQAGSTLITAVSSQIELINGANANNVYWQVGSSATIGTYCNFAGTILAMDSITLNTGATLDGRALARNGAVTLDTNVVTVIPEPSSSLLIILGTGTIFGLRRQLTR